MRICFITPSTKIGGYEKFLLNLIEGLQNIDENFENMVIAIDGDGELKEEFERIAIFKDLRAKRSRYAIKDMFKYIQIFNPEIVYVAFSNLIIPVYFIKKILKLDFKIVIGEHGFSYYNNIAVKSLLKKIYKKSEGIIAVSEEVKSHICEHLIISEDKVCVINNPIINKKSAILLKEEFNHKWLGKYKIILAIGRLAEDKGFQDLLKAYSIIKGKVGAKVIIAGDGEYKDYLKELAYELGIEDDVDFIGYVNNPYKVMKRSDLLVLTSKREGFGNVLVEALFSNLDIISYNCVGGPKEILENGKYGILIEEGNIEQLANMTIKYFKNDICFKDKIKKANDYTCEAISTKYKNKFIDIING